MAKNAEAYLEGLRTIFDEVLMIIETGERQLELLTQERDNALLRIEELERLVGRWQYEAQEA